MPKSPRITIKTVGELKEALTLYPEEAILNVYQNDDLDSGTIVIEKTINIEVP